MSEVKKLRFEYLDGIRGVAALIVVINHFRNAFVNADFNTLTYNFFWERLQYFFFTGHFCVQLFFVLSGFVLAYNSFYRASFLQKQWTKRLARLFLPVFISSLFYLIFSNYGLLYFTQLLKVNYTEWTAHHWTMHYDLLKFTIRCLFDFMLFADWQFVWNINSSLWTIPIELYWSYILFVIFYVINKCKQIIYKNLLYLLLAALLLLFYKYIGAEYGILFLFGGVLALNYTFIVTFANHKFANIILIIATIFLSYLVEINIFYHLNININWSDFMAVIYVCIALRSITIQKIFSNSIIVWLGRISFPMYLLHILVIASISSYFYISVDFFRGDIGLLLLLLITLTITFVISHLFTVFIDEPLMKTFDKVYSKSIELVKHITLFK